MKTEKQVVDQFKRAVNGLRDALKSARDIWPEANLYLASGTLNLMKGEHHSEPNQNARHDNVAHGIIFKGMDGGDW